MVTKMDIEVCIVYGLLSTFKENYTLIANDHVRLFLKRNILNVSRQLKKSIILSCRYCCIRSY